LFPKDRGCLLELFVCTIKRGRLPGTFERTFIHG